MLRAYNMRAIPAHAQACETILLLSNFFINLKTYKIMETSILIRWGLLIGIPLFCLLFYRFILRVFFGVVIVPEDKVGLVTKKYVLVGNQQLPEGRIIATNGEAGFQAQTLA